MGASLICSARLVRAHSSAVEHLTFNQRADGSTPSGLTTQPQSTRRLPGDVCGSWVSDMRKALAAWLPVRIVPCGVTVAAPLPLSAIGSVDELSSMAPGVVQVLSYHPGTNR